MWSKELLIFIITPGALVVLLSYEATKTVMPLLGSPQRFHTNIWNDTGGEAWGPAENGFQASTVLLIAGNARTGNINPTTRRGEITRAFKQRLRAGIFVALRTGIDTVFLTGGRHDSVDARRWILENFATDASVKHNYSSSMIEARLRMEARDVTDEADDIISESSNPVLSGIEDLRTAFAAPVKLYVENTSTTTATNVIQTKALLAQHAISPRNVVMVSSPTHIPRCLVFLKRHFPAQRTATVASSYSEFEIPWPQPPLLWVSFSFRTVEVASTRPPPVPPAPPLFTDSPVGNTILNNSSGAFGGDSLRRNFHVPRLDTREVKQYMVHPIAFIFPTAVISLSHSIVFNLRRYGKAFELAFLSTQPISALREFLALCKNHYLGHFDKHDVQRVLDNVTNE